MAINFNTDPYYDDYSEANGYYKILFKPGVAVQARELTQLQSILQNQITRFGEHIFKEGSLVIPGSPFYNKKYHAIKLDATYNSVNADDIIESLVGQTVTGAVDNLTAKVLRVALSENGDPPTLFVKYTNSGDSGTTKTFADGEVLTYLGNQVKAIDTDAIHLGESFSISSGVVFVKGHFVYFEDQTILLSKYTPVTDLIVGFDISETITTADDDSSLLDPANGSYNYSAPGADRYSIELTLATREFTAQVGDDPNFVEAMRIQNGEIISEIDVNYNLLGDEMARRTYEESGDYVVNEYPLSILEHLKTSDSIRDGVYTAAEGGDESKYVASIRPGIAYVKGYRIDNLNTTQLVGDKARDAAEVSLGTVALPFGSYVVVNNTYSSPELDELQQVDLYNEYNTVPGATNGTKVGTARVRHLEYLSGTPGTDASYRLYLFDIQMIGSYTFEDNVKQIYGYNATSANFTCDTVPTQIRLDGTVSTINGNTAVTGVGSRFSFQLRPGDWVTIEDEFYKVSTVTSAYNLTLTSGAGDTYSGVSYFLNKTTLRDNNKSSYVFPMPLPIIKTVDTNGTNTSYSSRRSYRVNLAAGVTTLTAGTGETFPSFSQDNYQLVVQSGGNDGDYIDLDGKVTRGGTPTGKTLTIDLSGDGYTTEEVYIIATVNKTGAAADKKVKSLVEAETLDFTTAAAAQATVLSLAKADIYRIVSIKETKAAAFGSPYDDSDEKDITDRYTLDNGQRATFYGLGSLTLKTGQPKPAAPIRVTFDYFTHGAGDYFSVDSYVDIDYKDIPTVTLDGTSYVLRDCLDFRPRINNAGDGFDGTGANVGEMIDFENDLITTYEYYLPRTDKIVLSSAGELRVVEGIPSLEPRAPKTPDDSMALYILKQNAYVIDTAKDIKVLPVENRRYTMRGIGKLENRIRSLEYYTSLTLLEVESQLFQVKDADGFDRYKNGFVVDAFSGHGVGDVFSADYACAIDNLAQELRPPAKRQSFAVVEKAENDTQRDAAGYIRIGDFAMLKYTSEEAFVVNDKATRTENLNPFNVINYRGNVILSPAVDDFSTTEHLPDLRQDAVGDWDNLSPDAITNATIDQADTVWGAWESAGDGTDTRSGTTPTNYTYSETKLVGDDVIQYSTIAEKMNDVNIKITMEGFKPSTKLFFFFNNVNVTPDVHPVDSDMTASDFETMGTGANIEDVITDASGNATAIFSYSAQKYNFDTGSYSIVISDSSTADKDTQETVGEAVFTSRGQVTYVADTYVTTRYSKTEFLTTPDERETPAPSTVSSKNFIDMAFLWGMDRLPTPAEKAKYSQLFANEPGGTAGYPSTNAVSTGITTTTIRNMTLNMGAGNDTWLNRPAGTFGAPYSNYHYGEWRPLEWNAEAAQVHSALFKLYSDYTPKFTEFYSGPSAETSAAMISTLEHRDIFVATLTGGVSEWNTQCDWLDIPVGETWTQDKANVYLQKWMAWLLSVIAVRAVAFTDGTTVPSSVAAPSWHSTVLDAYNNGMD